MALLLVREMIVTIDDINAYGRGYDHECNNTGKIHFAVEALTYRDEERIENMVAGYASTARFGFTDLRCSVLVTHPIQDSRHSAVGHSPHLPARPTRTTVATRPHALLHAPHCLHATLFLARPRTVTAFCRPGVSSINGVMKMAKQAWRGAAVNVNVVEYDGLVHIFTHTRLHTPLYTRLFPHTPHTFHVCHTQCSLPICLGHIFTHSSHILPLFWFTAYCGWLCVQCLCMWLMVIPMCSVCSLYLGAWWCDVATFRYSTTFMDR